MEELENERGNRRQEIARDEMERLDMERDRR